MSQQSERTSEPTASRSDNAVDTSRPCTAGAQANYHLYELCGLHKDSMQHVQIGMRINRGHKAFDLYDEINKANIVHGHVMKDSKTVAIIDLEGNVFEV